MENALTYLTRRCPRRCEYCALVDAKGLGKELRADQWIEAFRILRKMNISFNLILGNETWTVGWDLIPIFKKNRVPYALYTTAPKHLWDRYRHAFITDGVIDNLSCGIDYPPNARVQGDDDSIKKSKDAWKAFTWLKEHHPNVDSQGTVTIHKGNFKYLPELVESLSRLGVFCGVNFIHWDKDGQYDFFPRKDAIQHLCFETNDYDNLREVLDKVLAIKGNRLQNPQMLELPIYQLVNMEWHCAGDPYGGPTIDADGSLRVCGYRRGKYTPQFNIFDLPHKEKEWRAAVYADAMECPGCMWSYPWMFHYWKLHDEGLGKDVFVKHAGTHIKKENWSKRKNE